MWQWLEQHRWLLGWLAIGSVVSLVLVALLLPVVVVRMPADYFVRDHHIGHGPRGWLDWLWHIGKNLIGVLFVLVGVVLLFLPGQGLLTIVVGLLLTDFPGKRGLERRLVARPGILSFVNRMRRRRGHAPLQLGADAADRAGGPGVGERDDRDA